MFLIDCLSQRPSSLQAPSPKEYTPSCERPQTPMPETLNASMLSRGGPKSPKPIPKAIHSKPREPSKFQAPKDLQ